MGRRNRQYRLAHFGARTTENLRLVALSFDTARSPEARIRLLDHLDFIEIPAFKRIRAHLIAGLPRAHRRRIAGTEQ